MFSSKILFVVLVVIFNYSSGWIMNNVDLSRFQRNGLIIQERNEIGKEEGSIYEGNMDEWDMGEGSIDKEDMEEMMDDLAELRLSLIYPGTKWCGAGDTAENYDDLGSARETDMCCRAHDLCPNIMEAGETKHGLKNDASYTRLNCSCDEEFRDCLHAASNTSSTASQIGTVYFNALSTKCYREDYPVIGCNKRGGWLWRKCLEPKYDMQGERKYQWFDVPKY